MDIPEELRDKRTQAEKDKSTASSYWLFAVEYGVHYYIAGRYSMFARLTPAAGNQLHHAVELLLKACLAQQEPGEHDTSDTWQEILKYGIRYGHDLKKLWAEFRRRNPDPALAAHDDVIEGLNKFEDIRYPEQLIKGGALLSIGLYEVPPEHRTRPVDIPVTRWTTPENRRFYLELPRVDRLVQTLYKATHHNPDVLDVMREPHATEYLWLQNASPLLPSPPKLGRLVRWKARLHRLWAATRRRVAGPG